MTDLKEKRIVLIQGSPRPREKTTSSLLLQRLERRIAEGNISVSTFSARQCVSKNDSNDAFKAMNEADILVFAFPLYIFCLPAVLMRFLQDYTDFREHSVTAAHSPKVYAFVNSGFLEPEINEEAVRVIRSFCQHTGASFRFGVLIGGGAMLFRSDGEPMIKKAVEKIDRAFDTLVDDVKKGGQEALENVSVHTGMNRRFFFFMAHRGWFASGKKHGLKRKDLYRRPYLNNRKTG
jgi:multimeric flavodoxin WrbA